jgi:hypothetical protein
LQVIFYWLYISSVRGQRIFSRLPTVHRHIYSCANVFDPDIYSSDLSQCPVFFFRSLLRKNRRKVLFHYPIQRTSSDFYSSHQYSFLSTTKIHNHLPLYSLQQNDKP